MKFETKTKVFALVIITVALLISWAWRSATGGNIPVGKDAVIITGECIVINYDASEDTWDKAKAAWLEALKEHPRSGKGHTKAYY
jgi:hypothetical protein